MKFGWKRVCSVIAVALILGSRATMQPSAPIVVELFTSEGCSSCPPADALLQKLSDEERDVIALGEHVDYWDHQGWRDRFASPALTRRQQEYATRFNSESIYTPQMVVDGRIEFVGSDTAAARRALQRARAVKHCVVTIAVDRGPKTAALPITVTVSDLPTLPSGDRADIIVAVTEDRLQSDVKRGENTGRLLKHAAVVRHLSVAGEALAGNPRTVHAEIPIGADWQLRSLNVVAFVQERRSRQILGASAVRPESR